MPAPTFTNLTGSGASSATSFATASISPTGSRLILVSIHAYISSGAAQPAQPTVTGNGITYEVVDPQDVDAAGTDRATMWIFRGMAASPSAGAITIDFGAVTMTRCQWSVDQSDANVDTSGTNGSGAIVQATGVTTASGATSGSVNYPVAMTAGNSGFSAWGHQVQEAKTPRASWTELADVTTVSLASVETQYIAATDTAGSASWTTGSRAGGIIVEVKAGVSGTTFNLDLATETDTTLTLTSSKTATLGQATEADTVLTLSASKVLILGLATETDEAFAVGTSSGVTFELGLATETDTAFGLTLSKATSLGLATETDEALTLAASKAATLGLASESDSAAAVSLLKALTLGQSTETDESFTIVVSKTHVLGLPSETDETFALVLTDPRDVTVVANIRSNHVTGGVGLTDLVTAVRASHITGGIDVSRTLRTGSVEYVVAEVTFVGETAASIATATGQVQITTTDTTPTAADPNWVNPDVTTRTDVTGGAKLSLSKLHTAGTAATYRLWAKVTDNPEVPILLCGSFDVRS